MKGLSLYRLIAVWRVFVCSPAAISLAFVAIISLSFSPGLAGATHSPLGFRNDVQVVASERVPTFAVGSREAPRFESLVFGRSDNLKVARVDAQSHLANVVNLPAFRDRAVEVFAGQSVGIGHVPGAVALTPHDHKPITFAVCGASPQPTVSLCVYADLGEEARQVADIHAHNLSGNVPGFKTVNPFDGGRGCGSARLQD